MVMLEALLALLTLLGSMASTPVVLRDLAFIHQAPLTARVRSRLVRFMGEPARHVSSSSVLGRGLAQFKRHALHRIASHRIALSR